MSDLFLGLSFGVLVGGGLQWAYWVFVAVPRAMDKMNKKVPNLTLIFEAGLQQGKADGINHVSKLLLDKAQRDTRHFDSACEIHDETRKHQEAALNESTNLLKKAGVWLP